MASWGDRTSRDPGHDRPGSAAPAAALSATSASTLASGDLPHARGAQPERALSVRPADKVELFGLVRKLLVKAALQRHDRAAELAEQAVELAASVYGSLSLAVAQLRLTAARELYNVFMKVDPEVYLAPLLNRAWASIRAATAVIQVRLDTGTLLPGAVREEELEFWATYLAGLEAAQGMPAFDDAALHVASDAVGYDALLSAAVQALLFMRLMKSCPAADRHHAQNVVLAALDAIPTTAGLPHACGSELAMMYHLQLPFAGDAGHLDAAFLASARAKWTSPAVVNALRLRGSLQSGVAFTQRMAGFEARRMADVAARGFRTCGLPSCGKREVTVRHFKLCSGCDAVAYCCDEHHGVHWREGHRRECRHLRAAGAKPPSSADAA